MVFTPFTEDDLPTMANFNAAFSKCAVKETGSYEGLGTYGEGNKSSIPLSREPHIVIIIASNEEHNAGTTQNTVGIWVDGVMCMIPNDSYMCLAPYENGKISWYHPGSAINQLNDSGFTYRYVSIS